MDLSGEEQYQKPFQEISEGLGVNFVATFEQNAYF